MTDRRVVRRYTRYKHGGYCPKDSLEELLLNQGLDVTRFKDGSFSAYSDNYCFSIRDWAAYVERYSLRLTSRDKVAVNAVKERYPKRSENRSTNYDALGKFLTGVLASACTIAFFATIL